MSGFCYGFFDILKIFLSSFTGDHSSTKAPKMGAFASVATGFYFAAGAALVAPEVLGAIMGVADAAAAGGAGTPDFTL